jgi:hypothetical protein
MQSTPVGRRDPLGHRTALELRTSFPVLGVPVEIHTNSVEVLGVAERTFGGWRDLPAEVVVAMPARVLRVVVHPADPRLLPGGPRPFVHRVHSNRLLASDGVNLITVEYDQGEALAFIAPELLRDEASLRYNVLELMAFALVSRHDRMPVHTGAVVHNGTAILLAGPSKAGKSTLCYACVREGFQLLSEDVVYVSRTPRLRLWGLPWRVHLLADAVRFFPELADVPARLQPNGKTKLAVETARVGPDRALRHAERALVCVLDRHDSADSVVEPIDPAIAAAALSGDPEPGFDLYDNTPEVAQALAAGGAYRVTVGHDLACAAEALRQVV